MPEIEHEDTTFPVCPHCGYDHRYGDWWLMEGELECEECGKKFDCERVETVTFSTAKSED